MRIERFNSLLSEDVVKLFRDTVRTVCCSSYMPSQLEAWAPDDIDPESFSEPLLASYCICALEGNSLLGFGSIFPETGLLDMLYVSSEHQGSGVGKVLLKALEAMTDKRIQVYVSDCAKPFFSHMGYSVVREDIAVRRGISLHRWLMEKD